MILPAEFLHMTGYMIGELHFQRLEFQLNLTALYLFIQPLAG